MPRRWVTAALHSLSSPSSHPLQEAFDPTFESSILRPSYTINCQCLPQDLAAKVLALECDDETHEFMRSCWSHRQKPWRACFLGLGLQFLRVFFSVTDTNALLGTGSMFVLSRAHVRRLLAPALSAASPSPCLLDVGAGDGEVTLRLSPLFTSVTVTEVSGWMCRRLRKKGFSRVICCDSISSNGHFSANSNSQLHADAFAKGQVYDVVALMNLVDRCHEPAQLLKDSLRLLKPTGLILLAVVLPYGDFVEDGGVQLRPRVPLRMTAGRARDGATFEQVLHAAAAPYALRDNLRHCLPQAVAAFAAEAADVGLEVLSVSALPYLSDANGMGDTAYVVHAMEMWGVRCEV